jgi:hypothetical protein
MFEQWLADPGWDEHAGVGFPALITKQLMQRRRDLLSSLPNLRGYNPACWCDLLEEGQPDLCHAAVLLKRANPSS